MTQSTAIDNVQIDTTDSAEFTFQFNDGEFIKTNASGEVLDWSHLANVATSKRLQKINRYFKRYHNDN